MVFRVQTSSVRLMYPDALWWNVRFVHEIHWQCT